MYRDHDRDEPLRLLLGNAAIASEGIEAQLYSCSRHRTRQLPSSMSAGPARMGMGLMESLIGIPMGERTGSLASASTPPRAASPAWLPRSLTALLV